MSGNTLPRAGTHGSALTTMSPIGDVLIEGVTYRARLESGWAERGTEVVVLRDDVFGLIVEKSFRVPPKAQRHHV